MSLEFRVVDAFTTRPFCGNPAAVIKLPADHTYPDSTLLGIAAEFNLSETAYILIPKNHNIRNEEGKMMMVPTFGLRWFIPTEEIGLCGHATLASASVLFGDENLIPPSVHEVQFSTLAGVLTARRILSTDTDISTDTAAAAGAVAGDDDDDGAGTMGSASGSPRHRRSPTTRFEIELPASEIAEAGASVTEKMRELVKRAISPDVGVRYVGVCPTKLYDKYMLVEIDDTIPLKGMKLNSAILGELSPIVILCQENRNATNAIESFDYRTFATPLGLTEDPVCGSATSFAAPYWTSRTRSARGENAIQSVSTRGGELEVVWEKGMKTVKIRGQARVASRGEIYV